MSYLISGTRIASLTIGGTDYTSNLISWQVGDASANRNGFVSTTGTMILSPASPGAPLGGYSRNLFKRGTVVVLDVTDSNGVSRRHPRGYLYTISSSYNAETEETEVEIGCQITLAVLTDNPSQLLHLAPLPLGPLQQTLQGISASLSQAGKLIYQDNTGTIQTVRFFEGDTLSSSAAGQWVSSLGRTVQKSSPLAGTSAVPDEINLSYNLPAAFGSTETKVDIVTTESDYFLSYPAVKYVRTGNGLSSITGVSSGTVVDAGTSSACGNTPAPPAGSQQTPSCNAGYVLTQSPFVLPAHRTSTIRTEYEGPAGQVSRVYTETRGPAVEANGQYFADEFAYCRYTWSTRCQPNGACSTDNGMQEILLGYSEQWNKYGSAGELVETITDYYTTTLSGAQPFDWRSGVVDGVPQTYTPLSTSTMYRNSRVIQKYFQNNNSNIQETTTYTSITSRGTGIKKGNIDALAGIQTFERRTSTTISSLPVAPDTTVNPQTQTVTKESRIVLNPRGYTRPPTESGPLVFRAQAPIPFLLDSADDVSTAVAVYEDYLTRWTRGDSYGIQIGEALRDEVLLNWAPGAPFRYVDDRAEDSLDRVLALRMDSTQWGVSQEESAFVTNGIWVGYSNGTPSYGNNLSGNSQANLNGGAPIAPPASRTADTIQNETAVTTGHLSFHIQNNLSLQGRLRFMYELGVGLKAPAKTNTENKATITCWMSGFQSVGGDLAAPINNGTPLASNQGLLQTTSTVLVDDDLFS